MKRQEAERRGRMGELAAVWWLRLHGWRILGQRLKTKVGEVDIVARRGKMVAFIEVKTRVRADQLDQAVDAYRLRRVAAATRSLMPRFVGPGDDVRIDLILLAPWAWPRRLKNVWEDGR